MTQNLKSKTKTTLLIGPLPNVKANKIGGARISFSYLVDFYCQKGLAIDVINTKPYETDARRFLNPFFVLKNVFGKIGKADVVFLNVSAGGTKSLAPLLFILSKIWDKQFVFRPFGSRFQQQFEEANPILKYLFKKTILKSDLLFLQTKQLMSFFVPFSNRIMQLPTSRDQPTASLFANKKTFQKRFLYMGHVKETKGIDLILEAKKRLNAEYTIHIYGPIHEEKYKSLPTSIYKGLLKKEAVLQTLGQYDVLLLPTHFEGEGYPGAIVEAYSLGLPVIVTNWKSIPEIVENDKTGLLITPKSVEELTAAIQFFNLDNYNPFSVQAKQYFNDHFDAETVLSKVVKAIQNL